MANGQADSVSASDFPQRRRLESADAITLARKEERAFHSWSRGGGDDRVRLVRHEVAQLFVPQPMRTSG
jgi:hypothetical protein